MSKFLVSGLQKYIQNIRRLDYVANLNSRNTAQGTITNKLNLQTRSCNFGLPCGKGLTALMCSMQRNLKPTGLHMSAVFRSEIDYQEFKELRKKLTVIDVRESDEIRTSGTGTIPGSVNIPLAQVESALKRDANDFPIMYGRNKPSEQDTLVFVCLSGSRSQEAQKKAAALGYKKARTFKGGLEQFFKENNV